MRILIPHSVEVPFPHTHTQKKKMKNIFLIGFAPLSLALNKVKVHRSKRHVKQSCILHIFTDVQIIHVRPKSHCPKVKLVLYFTLSE